MNNTQKKWHDWFDHELNETRWTGYNLSGLESGSHKVLGTIGVNYIDLHNADYAKKLYEMGVNVIRLPFMLERLIPNYHPNNVYPNGFEFINKEYSNIIKKFVCECEKYGIDIILDIHNYGQFYFQRHGGYTSNLVENYGAGNLSVLDNRYSINASNELEIRTPGNPSRVDPFEYVVGGSGLPYVGNKFIYKAEVKIGTGNGDPWNQGKIVVNFLDANNYYEVSVGANTAVVELAKNINGVRTVLATAPFTYVANTSVTVEIDFNNTTSGSIIANINAGAVTLIGAIDNDLLIGRAGFFAAEAQMNVVSYQLTCFDASNVAESNLLQDNSAEIAWGKTVGSTTHSTQVHQFFYEQIFKEFDHLEGIIAYDYNEPHDLEIPTTSSNYLTTSTATVFQQAALDKIRELGSKKWFGWTSDDWGGAQNITQNYTNGADPNGRWGANFDIPFKDPLQRTFLTFHFYADKYATPTYNNSGTFGTIDGQTPSPYTKAEIDDQLDKLILRWKKINIERKANNEYPIPLFIGELGSPESSQWNETLDYTLEKLTKAGAGYSYFGIGRFLGNNLNNIAADFSEITQINGKDVVALTKIQERHKVVDKYLNKESFVKNSSKKSCKTDKKIVLFKTHCKKKKLPNKFVANWARAVKLDELLFTSPSSDNSNPTPTGMVNGWNTDLILSYNSAAGGWNDLYDDGKYRVIAWNNVGGSWNANSKPHNNWITNVNGGVPITYNDGFFAANLSKSGSVNDKKILFKSFNLVSGKYYRFRIEAINALQTQFSGDNPNLRLTVNGATIANTGEITVSQEYSVEFMATTSGVQELALYSNVIADGGNDILINYVIVEEADVIEVEVETCEKFNEYREVKDEVISSVALFYTDEENNKIAFDPDSISLEESCCYEETPIIPIQVGPIPTPRIWARNKITQLTSGTDANSVTNPWSVSDIYAQTFYSTEELWKSYNPVYELVVHKLVRKASGSNLRGYKWVHPVNNNVGATGKKFAGGKTWDQANNTNWPDKQTEWNVDISTNETWLKGLDPHKYIATGGQPLAIVGADPLVGAIPEGSFLRKLYFTPRTGNKTKHKMAFGIRIRIDNPNFKSGVPNQDPYIYGNVSNILVFRPKMYNLWDGSTVDFSGNNVLSHYFFDWVATEENSTQN